SVVVFQGEGVAETFGAPIYVAHMVAQSITAQMAPVLTALLLAGRSGTSFAAKIGTMKIRQELDVLAVRNMDIIKMLVLPRVLAIGLVAPLLTMLASASGILGGLLTGAVFLDLSPAAFLGEVQATLENKDITMALVKGLVFGVVIGLTGCFHGMRTENTADSVGFRTTAAVVSSTFFIIAVNSIFAALFNTFGW
ncbi:MAG: ABC transporter permease, partial [Desulfovermiculus sp.]